MVVGSVFLGNDHITSPAAETKSAIDITAPDDGAAWSVGSRHFVTWTAEGHAGDAGVRLSFSRDGGKTWVDVAEIAAADRRYLWTVPGPPAKRCRIRIQVSGSNVEDESEKGFSTIPSQEVPEYQWVNVTPEAAFAARDGAGALTYKGRMWLLGGWNPGDKQHFPRICNNEVWSSADGATWTLEKPNTFLDRNFDPLSDWEGRHTAGYAVHRGTMWIVGGDVNQGHYQSDVWNSSDGKNWTLVNKDHPVPWGPRALHYTVAFQDRIWVIGGQTMPAFGPAEEIFYRDVWKSADGLHWEKVVPQEPYWPQRGMIGGAAVFKDRIWILGGGTYDTPQHPQRKFLNDVWSSTDGVRWERHVEQAPWAPRQYHDVAVYDDRLWVLEGYGPPNLKDVWYSADGVNWYEVPDTPWAPRHAASVFVHDGALWMVAGNNMRPDVWKLQRTGDDVAQGGEPEELFVARPLTEKESFTTGIEGPACDSAGNIYAVNFARQQTIGKVTPDGAAEVFVTLPGKSVGNGIIFDRRGAMYVADYTEHNVLRIDPTTKRITVFAHDDRMNQPNDLAIAPDGTLYASDPNWEKASGQLWRIDTDGNAMRVAENLGSTNGIEVSPDGRTLYVNESVQRNIWAFPIQPDGPLGEKRLVKRFDDHGFDGMRCDVDGNLYVTRYGKGTVVKLSPDGKIFEEIDVLGARPSNLCFGGPDGRTVYVTEVENRRLIQFRVDRPGLAWHRFQQGK